MKPRSLPLLACLALAVLAAGCQTSGTSGTSHLILKDGSESPVLTLANEQISVEIAPELGGKIISIKDDQGREYLSRSERAYVRRTRDMKYDDTEFDGIDECFPSLSAGKYPAAPWNDVDIPDHGDLCYAAWQQVPDSDGITLQVKGPQLPYLFQRQAVLDERSLVLRYQVTNQGKEPFSFAYVFHPLFVGETGCRLDQPADRPVKISWSYKSFLGKMDEMTVWSALRSQDGTPLSEQQFVANTGRYYKYFTGKLTRGEAMLNYKDGKCITVSWPADILPYMAVWCSEGSINGLHHIAPEPTTSDMDSFTDAYKAGKVLTVEPGKSIKWTIRIRLGK